VIPSHIPGGAGRLLSKSKTFLFGPGLEPGLTRKVEPFQQIPGIEPQGFRMVSGVYGPQERRSVTPNQIVVEMNSIAPPIQDGATLYFATENVEALTQGVSCPFFVGLGPEYGEDRISAQEPTLRGQGQERQECHALRMGKSRDGGPTIRPGQIQTPEEFELLHEETSARGDIPTKRILRVG
jgi:hypothetical protein